MTTPPPAVLGTVVWLLLSVVGLLTTSALAQAGADLGGVFLFGCLSAWAFLAAARCATTHHQRRQLRRR